MKMHEPEMLRPNIEIIPAALEQKAILANLLELYMYDFCEFVDLEIGPDGRFYSKHFGTTETAAFESEIATLLATKQMP